MSNCVYLVLQESITFDKQYPSFVHATTLQDEALEMAKELNSGSFNGELHFSVRTVWL